MNKTELTAAVAQKAGLSKSDAAKVLGARNPGWQASEVHRRLCAEEGCRRLIIA